MDRHVLHNIVHRDSNNSSKDCPVCNGAIGMDDKSALMKKANEILDRKQQMGMSYSEDEKELVEFAELSGKPKEKIEAPKKPDADKKASDPTVITSVDVMSFGENNNVPKRIKVLPMGTIKSPVYGEVKIDKQVMDDIVQHFNENVRASSKTAGLPIDFEHGQTQFKDAAAGWITKLTPEKDGMYAEVEWTEPGQQALQKKLYKFISPAFYLKGYKDLETGKSVENVLTGAGLVNKPGMPHSLPPLVYSEQPKNALLTQELQSPTVFIEVKNTSLPKMDLHKIASTPKTERSSDEQAFLITHKDELTYKEYTSEFPQEITAKESKETVRPGQVVMSEAEVNELKSFKEEVKDLREFREKMKRQESIDEVKKLVFSEKGIKVPADQVEKLADVRLSLSGDALKSFDETLKSIPEKEIFVEKGTEKAVNMSENSGEVLVQLARGKVEESKKNGIQMSEEEAEDIILKERPELYSAFQART